MKKHNKLWVSASGEFGFGVNTYVIDNWTERDFDRIQDAHPFDRQTIANAIDAKRKKQRQLAERFIQQVEEVEVRHFYLDENGVVEIDPETGDEI